MDIEFKSNEERYFSWWLDDLKEHGVILRYDYESVHFKLCDAKTYPILRIMKSKTKVDQLSLLQDHVYTSDFAVKWNPEYFNIFYRLINDETCSAKPLFFANRSKKDNCDYTIFEIKPTFDSMNMTRLFTSCTQKWLYDKYGVYVELCKVPDIFKKTFTPSRYLFTDKSSKERKISFEIHKVGHFIAKIKRESINNKELWK